MKKMIFFKSIMMTAMVAAMMGIVGCDPEPDPVAEYTVSVTATTGGTAQASATKAAAGTTVTLTATASEGYTFSTWTVESGGATLASATATSTTFSMPAANVSIKAEFSNTPTVDPDGELWAGSDLKGTISTKTRLDAGTTYDLSDPLYIAEGGELNIPAGTKIQASNGFDSYILVLQGGKINVKGTASTPVEMTAGAGTRAEAGAWGGLVINGRAPLAGGGTASTEIDNDYPYGGTDVADNSGSIEYLILRYTGAKNSADVEHNGLTLNGVGNGTKIENVFIVDGADDGIEFFGGSVNVTNLLVVNSDDDMFDFTMGYSGTLKNAYGIWESGFSTGESDASGVEADGNFDGNFPDHTGQSEFRIEGVTFDLRIDYDGTDNDDFRMQNVLRIRRGAKATITNALVKGTGRALNLINLNDGKGGANTATSVSLTNDLVTPADNEFVYASGLSAADYPAIDASASGNTGASTSVFTWTGYDFGYGGGDVLPGALWEGDDLKGTISTPVRLDATTTYKITEPVYVAEGGILSIPAGTRLEGTAGFESYILVLQGGMINVAGTADAPVEMTGQGSGEAGSWGGLVINGRAPLAGGTTGTTEIDTDYPYGGNDPADNSGSIEYLILRGTGAKNSADIEHNGLTLNGVGNGTKIENIFVIDGTDDGIEFFGGSVDVTNLLVVNSDDDMFDFTQGYSGTLKNAYGIWESGFGSSESDPSGVEADGNHDGNFPNHTGQSDFTIDGMTIDLRLDYVTGDNTRRMQNALRIRRGAKATITNTLVKGTGRVENLVNLNDGKGGANTATSVSLTNDLVTPADNEFVYASGLSAADYPAINASVSGNTGASASVFTWTGYDF